MAFVIYFKTYQTVPINIKPIFLKFIAKKEFTETVVVENIVTAGDFRHFWNTFRSEMIDMMKTVLTDGQYGR